MLERGEDPREQYANRGIPREDLFESTEIKEGEDSLTFTVKLKEGVNMDRGSEVESFLEKEIFDYFASSGKNPADYETTPLQRQIGLQRDQQDREIWTLHLVKKGKSTTEQKGLPQRSVGENDERVIRALEARQERLRSFQPSGDIRQDFNDLLEIAGRKDLYQPVDEKESPEVILSGLTAIRDAWKKVLIEPASVDLNSSAKKLFYIDIPNEEISAINRLINFYLDRLSK